MPSGCQSHRKLRISNSRTLHTQRLSRCCSFHARILTLACDKIESTFAVAGEKKKETHCGVNSLLPLGRAHCQRVFFRCEVKAEAPNRIFESGHVELRRRHPPRTRDARELLFRAHDDRVERQRRSLWALARRGLFARLDTEAARDVNRGRRGCGGARRHRVNGAGVATEVDIFAIFAELAARLAVQTANL